MNNIEKDKMDKNDKLLQEEKDNENFLENRDSIIENLTIEKIFIENTKIEAAQKCDEESIGDKNKGDKITETDLQNNSKLDQNFERDKLEETQNFHEEHYDGKISNKARVEKRQPIIRTQTTEKIFSKNRKN